MATKKFSFNFEASDKTTRFELPEVSNVPFNLERVSKGKKDKEREFVTLIIDNHVYMLDGGILNETASFNAVINQEDKKKGLLSFLDGARISHSGGVIEFSIAA